MADWECPQEPEAIVKLLCRVGNAVIHNAHPTELRNQKHCSVPTAMTPTLLAIDSSRLKHLSSSSFASGVYSISKDKSPARSLSSSARSVPESASGISA